MTVSASAGAATTGTGTSKALASTGFDEQQILLFGSLLLVSGAGTLLVLRRSKANA
ncbi:LPXTG cell wall anchor domain-containing protein [Arthrobacter sp. NPDC092385]|uniref:LPXTG cell wall anchor domain-containing protein n=1 Tax=Arthrobacter sp. NPDC092385 TaxID=3363943 RepID=UPI0037F5F2AD